MENIPKISIIVPVFNVEQYLSKCLDSLINQTLHEIEIICVDDCSTDGSLKILQNYAKRDSRVCVFHLKQNFGTSYARKVGVSSARGSYIMFCDADDAFVSEACEHVCKEMERDPVDILQFETDIIFWGTHSLQGKKGLSDVLNTIREIYVPHALRNKNGNLHYGIKRIMQTYAKKLMQRLKIHILLFQKIYMPFFS